MENVTSVAQPQPAAAVQISRALVDPKVVDISHRLDSDPTVRPSFDPCRSCPFGLDIEQGEASSLLSLAIKNNKTWSDMDIHRGETKRKTYTSLSYFDLPPWMGYLVGDRLGECKDTTRTLRTIFRIRRDSLPDPRALSEQLFDSAKNHDINSDINEKASY